MKRSGKFYRKNEAEVMQMLGLKETKGSGCGWIEKEDGQDENIICQLKSTDAQSIKVNKLDIDKLMYNASVAHKLPIFAIQFLQSNQVFLLVRPEDIQDVAKYLDTGKITRKADIDLGIDFSGSVETKVAVRKAIKSSSHSRKSFMEENEKKFKKGRKSAL